MYKKMDKIQLSFLLLAFFVAGLSSVKITKLEVPAALEIDTQDEVILDCDYTIEANDNVDRPGGLVVKWFFDEQYLVYQWIAPNKPEDNGALRGKLDLTYKASDDPYKMYRSIKIKDIIPQLTGDYTCQVMTFNNEESMTKKMVVYEKEKDFKLTVEPTEEDTLNILCSAEDVFPKPNISIYANGKPLSQREEETIEQAEDGLYDVLSTVSISKADLDIPTTFTCDLSIPDANYTERREKIYNGRTIINNAASSSEISGRTGAFNQGSTAMTIISVWFFLIPIVLLI